MQLSQAASLGYHELQLQTWGTSVQDMVDNGLHLHSFGAAQRTDFRVVVKIPTTADGLRAAWQLADAHGVPVTLTGLFEHSMPVEIWHACMMNRAVQ